MKLVREPAVAGMFYPANKNELHDQVRNYIRKASVKPYSSIQAIIAPHAGYMYSGASAGYAYKVLTTKQFKRALVLAPAHRVGGFTCSAGDYKAYKTPLGEMAVDTDVVAEFLKKDGFDFYPEAHASEHSLEVQVPFIQILNPDAKGLLKTIFID